MFYHNKMPNHVSVSDEISEICTTPYTEVLKNQYLLVFNMGN